MATLRDLKKVAARCGATVDESSKRHGFVNVDTPAGFVWMASGTHALCVDAGSVHAHPGLPVWDEAVRDCLERIAYGIGPCDDPECDHCNGE